MNPSQQAELEKSRKQLFDLCVNHGLEKFWSLIERWALPAVRIHETQCPENLIAIGRSKMGGHPDLPETMDWPLDAEGNELLFVAQLNLSEFSPYNFHQHFPNSGMMYFFQCLPYKAAKQEVFLIHEPYTLVRKERSLDKTAASYLYGPEQKPAFITFEIILNVYSYQSFENIFTEKTRGIFENHQTSIELLKQELEEQGESDEDYDNLEEEFESSFEELKEDLKVSSRLYGYLSNNQNYYSAQIQSHCRQGKNWEEIYPGGWSNPQLKTDANEWVLLFEAGMSKELNWWGQLGMIYFMIKESDLQQGKFEKSVSLLDV